MIRQTRIATEADIQSLVAYYISQGRFSPEEIFHHLQAGPVREVNFNMYLNDAYVPQQVADLVYFGRQQPCMESTPPSTIPSADSELLAQNQTYSQLFSAVSECKSITQVRKLLQQFQL